MEEFLLFLSGTSPKPAGAASPGEARAQSWAYRQSRSEDTECPWVWLCLVSQLTRIGFCWDIQQFSVLHPLVLATSRDKQKVKQ